jgi:hypothetical protein
MSDSIIDGGGLMKGADGKLSLRRLLGVILIAFGIIAEFMALIFVFIIAFDAIKNQMSVWDIVLFSLFFVPGAVLIVGGLFIMKQITSQAIASIISKSKGK